MDVSIPCSSYAPTINGSDSCGNSGGLESASRVGKEAKNPQSLTEDEKKNVRELKQRDRKVKAHEQAHKAAGGAHVTGGPSYSFETGPDGKRYAVGGEVKIDTSKVAGDAEATIEKMEQVRKAALAPVDPSAQDQRVAAQAAQKEAQARAELRKQEQAQQDNASGPGGFPMKSAVDAYGASTAQPAANQLLDLLA
ncbi:MAG: putative metalloprotease CJM1_0395 family protein [Planctomycetota bacterium]|jgi:hypothetical protein